MCEHDCFDKCRRAHDQGRKEKVKLVDMRRATVVGAKDADDTDESDHEVLVDTYRAIRSDSERSLSKTEKKQWQTKLNKKLSALLLGAGVLLFYHFSLLDTAETYLYNI